MMGAIKKIGVLSLRNLKIYFRNPAGVFFSFLAPLIVLMLYILFLQNIQLDYIRFATENIPGFLYQEKSARFLLNSWLVAGVLSVSCFTVALGSMDAMVNDRIQKLDTDFLVTPVDSISLYISYFISAFVITLLLNTGVLLVGEVYILIAGGSFLGALPILQVFGLLVLTCLLSCLMMVLICSFVRSNTVYVALSTIFGTLIGFVNGAYMPISAFPKGIQYFCNMLPGAHSSALFRNLMMDKSMTQMFGAGTELNMVFQDYYSMTLWLFGYEVKPLVMLAFMGGFIVLFAALAVFVFANRSRSKASL